MDDRTVTISISDENAQFIAEQLASGNYSDESELFRAGLEALERASRLKELRRLIAEGDADVAAGRVHEFKSHSEMTRAVIARAKSQRE